MHKRLTEQIDSAVVRSGKTVSKITEVTVSEEASTFSIHTEMCKQAHKMGYDYGSMCGDLPIALARNSSIEKWRNIPTSDMPKIEGLMVCEDFRESKAGYIVELA